MLREVKTQATTETPKDSDVLVAPAPTASAHDSASGRGSSDAFFPSLTHSSDYWHDFVMESKAMLALSMFGYPVMI